MACLLSSSLAWSQDESFNWAEPREYTKTFDNIPVHWEEFYLTKEAIESFKGDAVDEILMTKHTYGESGEAVKLAGGYWFTVVGKREVLVRDENDATYFLQLRKCKALDRAKYILLGTNQVKINYRRRGYFSFATRVREGFDGCEIKGIYKWDGPSYYIKDITHPIRNYKDARKRRNNRADPLLGRVGR